MSASKNPTATHAPLKAAHNASHGRGGGFKTRTGSSLGGGTDSRCWFLESDPTLHCISIAADSEPLAPLRQIRLTPALLRCIFFVDTGVVMQTRVQKWGNSLALRIPKSFAAEAGFKADAAVELSLVKGKLVVQRVDPQPLSLEELLRHITDENLPGEWPTGPAMGKEVW
jgi:antitoxin MazE